MNQYIRKNNGKYNQFNGIFGYFLIEWITISFYAVLIIFFFLYLNNFNSNYPGTKGGRQQVFHELEQLN
jgi:amino acid transporter